MNSQIIIVHGKKEWNEFLKKVRIIPQAVKIGETMSYRQVNLIDGLIVQSDIVHNEEFEENHKFKDDSN